MTSWRIKAIKSEPAPAGIPTPEPGVYYGVSDGEYNRWTGSTRSSLLNKLAPGSTKTPAHVKWEMEHPEPATDAQILGRIVHAAVLEPERFHADFACGPDVSLNTKVGTDAWARAEDDHPGKELLRYWDWMTAEAIVDSVWNNPLHEHVRNVLIACPQREVTVVWIDKATGVKCRARIDALGTLVGMMADPKTTECAAESAFEKTVIDYGYDLQAALYRRAADEVGWDIRDSLLLPLEKTPPFLADVHRLSNPVVQEGERKLVVALERWAESERSGLWDGYGRKTKDISYPEWYWRRLDREMDASAMRSGY